MNHARQGCFDPNRHFCPFRYAVPTSCLCRAELHICFAKPAPESSFTADAEDSTTSLHQVIEDPSISKFGSNMP